MKKIITIVIIVLVCLCFGYWLLKISPPDQTSANYNSLVSTTATQQISTPPVFDPATDHYEGNKDAKNVFIEYGDLECPACAAYSDMLKQVPAQFPDTVFVYRYFPLVQIHKNTVEAALAAEAANAQGKFWEMHDLMYTNQADWQDLGDPLDTFAQYAQQIGVADITKFKNDVINKTYLAKIQKDNDEAYDLNLQGTPTFYFNGHQLQNTDFAGLLQQAQQYVNK